MAPLYNIFRPVPPPSNSSYVGLKTDMLETFCHLRRVSRSHRSRRLPDSPYASATLPKHICWMLKPHRSVGLTHIPAVKPFVTPVARMIDCAIRFKYPAVRRVAS